jgi:putative ABC transport system permease protein
VALAWAGVRWFRYLSPFELPRQAGEVNLNWRVLLFAAALSITTTLLFTLVPALTASNIDLSQGLRSAGRGYFGGAGRRRTAQVMVAVEMALSFVLVTGAGLLMSSAVRLEREQLGFDVSGIAAAYGDLPGERYATQESRDAFERTLRERLEALP